MNQRRDDQKGNGSVNRRRLLSALMMLALLPVIISIVAFVALWGLHRWGTSNWNVVLVCSSLFAGLAYGSRLLAQKVAGQPFQFSIRTLLAAFAVVALFMGTVGRWWVGFLNEQSAVDSVRAHGATVYDKGIFQGERNALYKWLGFDPFERERILELKTDSAVAEVIAQPRRFDEFVTLSFGAHVTSAAFENVERLNQLARVKTGEFLLSAIDDEGLRRLQAWTDIEELFFNGCRNVTDAGLAHLTALPKLRQLSLVEQDGGMVITDAGLAHVGKMKGLKSLMLQGLVDHITDAGLVHLHQLTGLEELIIRETAVSHDGIRALYAALPDCYVITDRVVPGPRNVRQIVVRPMEDSTTVLAKTSEPAQIAGIHQLIEQIRQQPAGEETRFGEPWPADYRLEFRGATRVLYEVRVGSRTFVRVFRRFNVWMRWPISAEQQQQLLTLRPELETPKTE